MNTSMETFILTNFLENFIFLLSIYTLRHVQDEFSINFELKLIATVWYITGFVTFFFLLMLPHTAFVTNESIQYFYVLRGLLCLIVTAVLPLRQSYRSNTIIPFPLNEECIKSLEMALLMPTSANYFYNYLENLC
jgi:cell division protein FtsW (lipid II flippase)